nr:PREDICTED: uncharacterized protein LOC109039762 [Bemisia tabaci]
MFLFFQRPRGTIKPLNHSEVLGGPDSKYWREAIEEELQNIEEQSVWTVVKDLRKATFSSKFSKKLASCACYWIWCHYRNPLFWSKLRLLGDSTSSNLHSLMFVLEVGPMTF